MFITGVNNTGGIFSANGNDDAKAFILAVSYSLFLSHPGTAGEGETENTEG
jgi:hypothetical protein